MLYSYWQPGGKTGTIDADNPYHAASLLFRMRPRYCGGSSWPGQGGARYMSDDGLAECRIYQNKPLTD